MRIIAGTFKGRTLKRPGDKRVRVTTDRVREAWFSILAPKIEGARVLDLFSGSGILGFEALSRGARSVDFVEVSARSVEAIRSNVLTLGVEARVAVRRGDALRFVARLEPGAYDLTLADPPFSTDQAIRLVEAFRKTPFSAVMCVEHPATLNCTGDETRRYGDVALTFCYAI